MTAGKRRLLSRTDLVVMLIITAGLLTPLTAVAPEAHQIMQPSSTAVSTVVAPPTRSP